MKKITIGGIVFLLILPLAYSLDNCKGTMFQQDIPCLLLLPVNQSTTACNTLTVSVYSNGSTLLYTQTMAIYNPFKCNATFNQTDFGTYTGQYGTEDSFTIIIEEDKNQELYLYLLALFVYFILVGLGYWKEEGTFLIIAGMLAMIIGLNIFNNGFPNLTNEFLKNSMVVIIWGVGAVTLFFPIMEFFESWRDKG